MYTPNAIFRALLAFLIISHFGLVRLVGATALPKPPEWKPRSVQERDHVIKDIQGPPRRRQSISSFWRRRNSDASSNDARNAPMMDAPRAVTTSARFADGNLRSGLGPSGNLRTEGGGEVRESTGSRVFFEPRAYKRDANNTSGCCSGDSVSLSCHITCPTCPNPCPSAQI
jgi:hypothetical protein